MEDDMKVHLYDRAVDLYLHEDKLNWVKLNNLFYVSGGLLAILGFTLDLEGGLFPLTSSDAVLVLAVSAGGLLTCFVFGVALHYGVKYLGTRKEAVMRLERCLTDDRNCWVVTPRSGDGGGLRTSPTSMLLRLTPYLMAVGWSSLAVLALLA